MRIVFIILSVLSIQFLDAQTSTNATGTTVTGANGSSSYSVGQVVCTTNSSAAYTITQGVQQPYEIFEVSSIDELNNDLIVNVFPNPTYEGITIKFIEPIKEILEYYITDNLGKLITSGIINEEITQISIDKKSVSNLRLEIINKETRKHLKSYNLIKL